MARERKKSAKQTVDVSSCTAACCGSKSDARKSLTSGHSRSHSSSAEVAAPTRAADVPANSTAACRPSTCCLTSDALDTTSMVSGGLHRISKRLSADCTTASGSHRSASGGGGGGGCCGGGGEGRCTATAMASSAGAGAGRSGAEPGRTEDAPRADATDGAAEKGRAVAGAAEAGRAERPMKCTTDPANVRSVGEHVWQVSPTRNDDHIMRRLPNHQKRPHTYHLPLAVTHTPQRYYRSYCAPACRSPHTVTGTAAHTCYPTQHRDEEHEYGYVTLFRARCSSRLSASRPSSSAPRYAVDLSPAAFTPGAS